MASIYLSLIIVLLVLVIIKGYDPLPAAVKISAKRKKN
jgi:hypothetical protein